MVRKRTCQVELSEAYSIKNSSDHTESHMLGSSPSSHLKLLFGKIRPSHRSMTLKHWLNISTN